MRRIITITLALAIAAIAAPAATAQPADMHGAEAQAWAQEQRAQQQRAQDLRSADAIDAARNPRKAIDAPGATAADSQSRAVPVAPGQPTWATNPKPITPAPVVKASANDDGVDWETIGIGIAGTLLILGGIVALTNHARHVPRHRAA